MDAGRLIVGTGLGILEPLSYLSDDPSAVVALLDAIGWDLGPAGLRPDDLTAAARALSDVCRPLQAQLDAAPGSELDVAKLGQLLFGLADAAVALRSFGAQWQPSAGLPADLPARLVEDLLGHLFVLYLADHHPVARAVLELLGAIVYESGTVTITAGGVVRSSTNRPRIDFSALSRLWTQPGDVLKDRLGVGAQPRPAQTVADDLFPIVADLLRRLRIHALYGDPGGTGGLSPVQRQALQHTLRIAWAQSPASGPGGAAAMLDIAMLLRDAPTRALVADVTGVLGYRHDAETWSAEVTLTGNPDGVVISSAGVSFADSAASSIEVSASARYPAGGRPFLRLGATGSVGFEIASADLFASLDLAPARADIGVSATLHDLHFVSAAPAGDGFLTSVLPGGGVGGKFDLTVTWTRSGGLRLGGSPGLNAIVPLGQKFGPLQLIQSEVGVSGTADATIIRATLDAALTVGPFAVVVDGLGLALVVAPTPGGGSLGPLDAAIDILPPHGIGLAIDATAVSGGGFLSFDQRTGQYTGVFDLTIAETISVKAIGIIATRLPGGRPGFALLIIITAEGFKPVPLGLGFELTGIGGLLALNRTVAVDRVRGGLGSGVLDSILFVKDPVHNASRVLGTLDQVFPLAADRLLIGPLAEISWGEPRIVRIRIALLLEIPRPIRAVLLAALSVLLPDPKQPLVEIHVDAIGVLDLGRRELALDASLHHSRLLDYALTGDMALRLNWGAAPAFLLSLGGFHPRFTPPAGLRPLKRMSLSLTGGNNPRIRLESYLAITSNTIQMGALASVYAEVDGFGIDGGGAFDALIAWSPFALDVLFQAWVRIFGPSGTLLAARIAVAITGPTPWHITGVAEVQLLFFTIKIGIEISVGAAQALPPLEAVDLAKLVWDEAASAANWHAALPDGVAPGVTLAPAQSAGTEPPVVVHPLATLTMRQKAAPLGTTVTRVGARLPKDGSRQYDLDLTPPAGVQSAAVRDLFAPGEFMELSEDLKLSGASFVSLPSGVELRPATSTALPGVGVLGTDVVFETLDVSDLAQPATPGARVRA